MFVCMYILNMNYVRAKQNTLRGFMFVTSSIHIYMYKCKKDWKGVYKILTI